MRLQPLEGHFALVVPPGKRGNAERLAISGARGLDGLQPAYARPLNLSLRASGSKRIAAGTFYYSDCFWGGGVNVPGVALTLIGLDPIRRRCFCPR